MAGQILILTPLLALIESVLSEKITLQSTFIVVK